MYLLKQVAMLKFWVNFFDNKTIAHYEVVGIYELTQVLLEFSNFSSPWCSIVHTYHLYSFKLQSLIFSNV